MFENLIESRLEAVKELQVIKLVEILSYVNDFMSSAEAYNLTINDDGDMVADYTAQGVEYINARELYDGGYAHSDTYHKKRINSPELTRLNTKLNQIRLECKWFDWKVFQDVELGGDFQENLRFLLQDSYSVYEGLLIKEERQKLVKTIKKSSPRLKAAAVSKL